MVEIFRTNINEPIHANAMAVTLRKYFPESGITFDLEDCDKILRIEAARIPATKIIEILKANGYQCEILL